MDFIGWSSRGSDDDCTSLVRSRYADFHPGATIRGRRPLLRRRARSWIEKIEPITGLTRRARIEEQFDLALAVCGEPGRLRAGGEIVVRRQHPSDHRLV